jgi:lactate dehydrogenase-like 2-hydroxyacid dehydrogenase
MSKIDILQVSRIPPFLSEGLQARFEVHQRDAANAQVLSRVRAFVGGGEARIDRALMDACPKLEVITICGVGYDGVEVAAAKSRGVPVTHTPDVLNDDVADLGLGLLLSVARNIPAADQFTRRGDWEKGPFPLTRKLTGARLGIVGMGRIGQAIAKRAAAFDMDIRYHTRSARSDVAYAHEPSLLALAAWADFLLVITPGGAATRHLINAEVLTALGPQGYLINVARGSVVDEEVLTAALQQGRIAGAGLDVYVDEPRVPAALRALPNVVLTPHMASGTAQTRGAMSDLTLANLQAHFDGQALITPVPECRG